MSAPSCPLCGQDLFLGASFSVPLDYIAHTPFNISIGPSIAVSSTWDVTCENGHVVAASESGNDYAEEFEFTAIPRAASGPVEQARLNAVEARLRQSDWVVSAELLRILSNPTATTEASDGRP